MNTKSYEKLWDRFAVVSGIIVGLIIVVLFVSGCVPKSCGRIGEVRVKKYKAVEVPGGWLIVDLETDETYDFLSKERIEPQ